MLVKDIMNSNVFSVSKDDSVQKFMSLMEKNKIHEAPVLNGKEIVGMVTYKDVINIGITEPQNEKISSIMNEHPHTLSPDQTMEEAAQAIFQTGVRALPVVDKKKLVGIISTFDIIKAAEGIKEFKKIKAKDVMSAPILANIDTDIGKARVIMRENNVSILPVLDNEGNLTGVVTPFDMLKAVKPHDKMSWYSMAGEMERIMGISISTIMDQKMVTATSEASLNDIAELLIKNNSLGVVIIRGIVPEGIVVAKDLLEVYVSTFAEKGIQYQIIGMEGEDSFITDTVNRMIGDTVNRISTMYNMMAFFMHVKRHEAGYKGKTNYSIRVRVRTDKGMFISQASKWDMRDAVGESLDKLERIMIHKKEQVRDISKRRNEMRKASER